MRIYLTGADGMFGTAFFRALSRHPGLARQPRLGVSVTDFDIADADAVRTSVRDFRPDVIVHAAANAIVDACENDPAMALRTNVQGTSNVAEVCRDVGARLVYLSSDYLFDGSARPPDGYPADAVPRPLNIYGLTKLAGERVTQAVDRHLIIRTSWLFGGTDENTDQLLAAVRAMLAGERPALINDQVSRPTYARDLAEGVVRLLALAELPTGVLHLTNTGQASWYEAGLVAADQLRRLSGIAVPDPEPVPLAQCGLAAHRPRYSVLGLPAHTEGAASTLPHWSDAVRRYCAEVLASGGAVSRRRGEVLR
jgi:dTDP-4-dehydrorhamnose reductase